VPHIGELCFDYRQRCFAISFHHHNQNGSAAQPEVSTWKQTQHTWETDIGRY
jgi:hypothetical protein